MRYALAPRAIVTRARMLAISGAAAAAAPAWLVVVLVAQLGLASRGVVLGVGVAIAVVAAGRGVVGYAWSKRRLAELVIDADDEGLTVRAVRGEMRVPKGAIARAVEIEGRYGGLRLEVTAAGLPSRIDVPRGGNPFADLRARVASWITIERAPRRGKAARFALGAAVVLALFFVPFVVSDARGSRVAVAVVLLAAWGAMRAAVGRT